MQNIIKHNDELQWSNEHTSYKNIISHNLFLKGWFLLCVRDELETGTDCYIDPAVLLSHLGWVTQPWVTEGPKPSVCHWFSCCHLVPNSLKPSVSWLYYCLTPTCYCYSSAYLHRYISWLMTQSRVNMLQVYLHCTSNILKCGWYFFYALSLSIYIYIYIWKMCS